MTSNIKTIYWHLTRQCNLRCSYCYFSAGRRDTDELNESELLSVANDIFLIKPMRIVFTGGEPLLHESLIRLSSLMSELLPELKICLNTNGILINSEIAKTLDNIFHEVRISVDSIESINDELRGKGTFRKALKAYQILLPFKTKSRIFITVNTQNILYLPRFLDYLINQDITNIHISPLKLIGRAQEKDLIPNDLELKRIVEDYWWNRFGLKMNSETDNCTNCGIGSFLTINPNGDLFPCHALSNQSFRIGNVKNSSLKEILTNSKLFQRLSSLDMRSENINDDYTKEEIPHHVKCLASSPDVLDKLLIKANTNSTTTQI